MKALEYAGIATGVAGDVIGRKLNIDGMLYPLNLGHIITKQCNFRCKMCNIGKARHSNKDDLTLSEIDEFAQSKYLKKVFVVGLSGGEPFMRPDVVDIAQIYADQFKSLQQIMIATNASMVDKIESDVTGILESTGVDLDITVSIDGIGKVHDDVRSFPGSYKRILETIDMLKKVKKKHDNLDIGLRYTILPSNYKHMIKVYDLAKKMGVGFMAKPAVSGGYFENVGEDYSFNEKQKWEIISDFRKIAARERKDLKLAKGRSLFADVKHISFIDFLDYSIDYIKDPQKQIFPCYATFSSVWLENNGDIHTCPILYRKVGNIREKPFDEVWQSEKMKKARAFIKTGKCACFTNCSQIPSLVMNTFPKIMVERLKRKSVI